MAKNFQIGGKLQTHRYKKLKYTQTQNMEGKKLTSSHIINKLLKIYREMKIM